MGVGATGSQHRGPGLVLADSQVEAEANRYLHARLRILYAIMASGALSFYVISHLVPLLGGYWTLEYVTHPAAVIHLASTAVAAGLYLVLRRRRGLPDGALRALDTTALYTAAGACLAIYALHFELGSHDVISLLGLFLVARAVVVPSTAGRTVLLALPCPFVLLGIDLAYGTAYAYTGAEIEDPGLVWSQRVWTQVVLWFAIAIAGVASRVGFSLRRQVEAARRIGQYHLEERIGAGAMGEVYRATHAMLRRPTAIKLLRPEITGQEAIDRFEREVRLASRLAHPHTVRIYDFGRTAEGAFYYAMEYLEGLDLQVLVGRYGPMPPARVLYVLVQASRSLAEAHGHGFVHRDVKPSNVMLCVRGGEHDVVKVVDFGLVKEVGAREATLTQVGSVCGTPETISPEVLSGEPATPASDLYALGAVGCFLLTGRAVFDGRTAADFIGHHLYSEPVPPSARGVEVPADLEEVLLRCLRKDPAERPPSARAFAAALAGCGGYGAWTEEDAASWWARSRGGTASGGGDGPSPGDDARGLLT